ncbi:MAG TPA: phospholipase D family protein [Flavobacteriales bacterium]|nr:phospholipase D family protein [Flavobacteriales bacterium]
MAKFLNTTGVSYHLEQLIDKTEEKLILISPYLQFTQRIKEHLENLNLRKRDIRIVYRDNKLQIDELTWLAKQIGIRTSLCKNLHAKCYLNEKEAIITSMNLYEFSQLNNNEMGIYITKADDAELYKATHDEVIRLLTISEEIRVTVQTVAPSGKEKTAAKPVTAKEQAPKAVSKGTGYCIRTGVSIPFNLEKPLSYEAYKSWSKFSNPDYPEKFCHFSGEASNGETTVSKPILKKNWKKAKEVFDL